jgi:hypothetical protein
MESIFFGITLSSHTNSSGKETDLDGLVVGIVGIESCELRQQTGLRFLSTLRLDASNLPCI